MRQNNESFGYLLLQICKAHRARAQELLSQIGLHTGQEMLLLQLWRHDGSTHSELADEFCNQPATITRMVDRLASAGLVEPQDDPEDRRISRVYLTENGQALPQPVEEVWQGLDAVFQGAYGVFSVQNYWLPNVGAAGEVRQGKQVVDSAKAAGVKHLVYTSVGAAHRGMGLEHFATKWEIEQYIQTLGLPYTIVRPVAFMDNYNWQRAAVTNGTLTGWGLPLEKGLQLIAAEDINLADQL